MASKFRIFLISIGQIRFFYVCHFNGKYIVTVIQCLQHCYFLQLLHQNLLLNDFLMIDKKKEQVTSGTCYTIS